MLQSKTLRTTKATAVPPPKPGTNNSPWPTKPVDSIDILCSEGEDCLLEDDVCTDSILDEEACVCGSDLRYACGSFNEIAERLFDTEKNNVHTEPLASPTKPTENPVAPQIEPADGGILESVGVGVSLALIVGCMLYSCWLGVGDPAMKRKGAKRRQGR